MTMQGKSVVLKVKIMVTFGGIVTGRSHDRNFWVLVMFWVLMVKVVKIH